MGNNEDIQYKCDKKYKCARDSAFELNNRMRCVLCLLNEVNKCLPLRIRKHTHTRTIYSFQGFPGCFKTQMNSIPHRIQSPKMLRMPFHFLRITFLRNRFKSWHFRARIKPFGRNVKRDFHFDGFDTGCNSGRLNTTGLIEALSHSLRDNYCYCYRFGI